MLSSISSVSSMLSPYKMYYKRQNGCLNQNSCDTVSFSGNQDNAVTFVKGIDRKIKKQITEAVEIIKTGQESAAFEILKAQQIRTKKYKDIVVKQARNSQLFEQELEVFESVSNKLSCIPKYYGHFKHNDKKYIFMEYVDMQSLSAENPDEFLPAELFPKLLNYFFEMEKLGVVNPEQHSGNVLSNAKDVKLIDFDNMERLCGMFDDIVGKRKNSICSNADEFEACYLNNCYEEIESHGRGQEVNDYFDKYFIAKADYHRKRAERILKSTSMSEAKEIDAYDYESGQARFLSNPTPNILAFERLKIAHEPAGCCAEEFYKKKFNEFSKSIANGTINDPLFEEYLQFQKDYLF